MNFSMTKDPKLQEMFSTVKSLGKIEEEKTTIGKQPPNIKPLPLLQSSHSEVLSSSTPPLPQPLRPERPKQTPASSSVPSVATTSPPVLPSKTLKQKQAQLYTATTGPDIIVQMPSDKKTSTINGSCQMNNGDILLTDYDNKNVKRLNRDNKPTDYLELPGSPRGICCIGDEEAVVTGVNSNIYFLSITRRNMLLTKTIRLSHSCKGIAHHNGRLFVSNSGTKVNIYSTSGKLLKTIKRDNNGVNMFSTSQHICVFPDGSKIYVADRDKGLVILDSEGNHLSTYISDDLKVARGVCVDSQGRVLVCGNGSNNVLQLAEGVLKVVCGVVSGKHMVTYPMSLCINNHNSKLIVSKGTDSVGCNHIRVFDLNLGE